MKFTKGAIVCMVAWVGLDRLPLAAQQPVLHHRTVDAGYGTAVNELFSVAVVNGHPAVCFTSSTDGTLHYARNTSPNGDGAWPIRTLDLQSPRKVGAQGELLVIGGNPAILYQGGPHLVRALDPNGDNWGPPVEIGAGLDPVGYMRMRMVDGRPAFVFANRTPESYDVVDHDLMYIRAVDELGTQWERPITIESSGNTGLNPSLEIVDGFPAVSYYQADAQDLRYRRALNAQGTSWGPAITVEGTGANGYDCQMKVVNGHPAIVHMRTDPIYQIRYVRATNPQGTAWGAAVAPLVAPEIGSTGRLEVVGGVPMLFYTAYADWFYPRVSRALDANGAAWGAPVGIDTAIDSGLRLTPLILADGRPAAFHLMFDTRTLEFRAAADATGASWPIRSTLNVQSLAGITGEYPCMRLVAGHPAISYHDNGHFDLMYARALDPEGDAWGGRVLVDSGGAGKVGAGSSLAVIDGRPAVSYYDTTNTALKYARATDATGGAWGAPQTLVGAGPEDSGSISHLAEVQGRPAIAYYDATLRSLRYMRALDSAGTLWEPPVTLDEGDGEYAGMGVNLVVVDGHPAVAYGATRSPGYRYARALDPTGQSWGPAVGFLDAAARAPSTFQLPEKIELHVFHGVPMVLCARRWPPSWGVQMVRSLDARGDQWAPAVPVFTSTNSLEIFSTCLSHGAPTVFFEEVYSGTMLRHTRALDPLLRQWSAPETLTRSNEQYPMHLSMLSLPSGNPAVAFYEAGTPDASLRDLGFFRLEDSRPDISVEFPPQVPLVSNAGEHDFGILPVGVATSRTFTIRNVGPGDLRLDAAHLRGSTAPYRVEPVDISGILAPQATREFTVRCAPAETGDFRMTLALDSNDPDEGLSFLLRFRCTAIDRPRVEASPAVVRRAGVDLPGRVTDLRGAPLLARGVVHSPRADPEPPRLGGAGVTDLAVPGPGAVAFMATATSLSPGQEYQYRAYASNEAGTGYSEPRWFRLLLPDNLAAAGTLTLGRPRLAFQAQPGRVYWIERCADLAAPDWVMVAEITAGPDGEIGWSDPDPWPGPRAYYRLSGSEP